MSEKRNTSKRSDTQGYSDKDKPLDNFTKAMKKIVSVPKNKLKDK